MNSEGGGIRSERGWIRREGGGWELVGRALVAVRGGARWCRLVVVVRRSSPVVVRSLSFVRLRWRLASLVWGVGQWTALAVH